VFDPSQWDIHVHYAGWPEEYDEWVPLPPQEVIDAVAATAGAGTDGKAAAALARLPPPLRTAVSTCRLAPPMTRSELVTTTCTVCANKRAGQLVFCDASGCGRAYHLSCHKPPLAAVPKGRWVCSAHGGRGGGAKLLA
jgi:hypothetical protein